MSYDERLAELIIRMFRRFAAKSPLVDKSRWRRWLDRMDEVTRGG